MDTATMVMIFSTLLGGGGVFVVVKAILEWHLGRKKQKFEVSELQVKTAMELEMRAMERYGQASAKLDAVEKLLLEVRSELMEAKKELEIHRDYIEKLKSLLKKHKITVPEMPGG